MSAKASVHVPQSQLTVVRVSDGTDGLKERLRCFWCGGCALYETETSHSLGKGEKTVIKRQMSVPTTCFISRPSPSV